MNILSARNFWRVSATLATGLSLSLGVVACGDDEEATPETESATANLRVLHLSPDAPSVDVHVNGASTPTVRSLAYPTGTDYLSVPAADYDFDIAPAGAGLGASVLAIRDVALGRDKSYTVVAYDQVASLKAMALEDNTATVPAGKARIRAIHAAAGVGQVDIWNVPESGEPAPLYTDVDFGVAGNHLEVAAQAYRLGFDVNNDATPDLLFQLPALAAGTIANVFAVARDGQVSLIIQTQAGVVATANPVP